MEEGVEIKRKVIEIAGSTQLVSLPKKWAVRNRVKKGDELEIVEVGDSLMVRSESGVGETKKKTINIEGIEPYLNYMLHALYERGYGEVTFLFSDEKTAEAIQKILREEVVGFEIVEQTVTSCVARAVAGALPSEYDTMFRRAFQIAVSMFDGIVEVFRTGNILPINSLIYMDSTNSKYTSFCKRMINRNIVAKENTTFAYMTVTAIDQIAAEFKYLCYEILRLPNEVKEIDKSILDLFMRLQHLLKDTQELFNNYSLVAVLENMDKRRQIIMDAHKAMRDAKESDVRFLHYVITIAQGILILNRSKMGMEI